VNAATFIVQTGALCISRSRRARIQRSSSGRFFIGNVPAQWIEFVDLGIKVRKNRKHSTALETAVARRVSCYNRTTDHIPDCVMHTAIALNPRLPCSAAALNSMELPLLLCIS